MAKHGLSAAGDAMTDRPFTTRHLADRWQCSERHLRNMVEAGKLPAFRVGRIIRRRGQKPVKPKNMTPEQREALPVP